MILGVQVEESELTLTIELPVPADLPLPPGMFKPGEIVTIMKMVMQIWSATSGEVQRVPALGELASHMSTTRLMNPAGWMQQTLGRLPDRRRFIPPDTASAVDSAGDFQYQLPRSAGPLHWYSPSIGSAGSAGSDFSAFSGERTPRRPMTFGDEPTGPPT